MTDRTEVNFVSLNVCHLAPACTAAIAALLIFNVPSCRLGGILHGEPALSAWPEPLVPSQIVHMQPIKLIEKSADTKNFLHPHVFELLLAQH